MKHKIINRMISLVIAIATLISVMPMTAITVLADEFNESKNAETGVPVATLTPAESVEKEMASRNPIKKDRTEGKDAKYAVYVNGKLHAKGELSEMWNLALELAPYAVEDADHSNGDKKELVEFVLYTDIEYNGKTFSEKTMTVSNKKITIDLNGHVLKRTDGGSVIKVTKNAVLTIMDSDPAKVNKGTLDSKDKWSYDAEKGKTPISGGVITGGNCGTGDGGGLYIDGKSTVYLQGGTIAGNKADVGSGVYLEGGSTLDMSLGVPQICYNYSVGTTSDGGAIFLRSDCAVIGGYVHHNLADDYGGGIRAKGNNILIKNVVIYANKAEEYGGGLYIERSSTGQTVTVTGCKIIGNYAGEGGGGAYIYDLKMVYMSDCWVENNTADDEGGGICVSDWTGTDLTISGKMIIRNNYESKSKDQIKSNLYLEGDDDLIVGTLSIGSEIWIRTEESASDYNGADNPILADTTSSSHLFFFADEDGFCVMYQDDPNQDNYRNFYLYNGIRTEKDVKVLEDYATKLLTNKKYSVSTGEYAGMEIPLYKGYFEYILMSTTDFYSASPFYYSDGYFLEDPTVYNTHLATMSVNLAVAAFGRYTTDVGNNAYANHFANIKQLYADIGCSDSNFFANEDYQIKPTYYGDKDRLSTIAVAISQKEISVNDDSYTLVPIAIRGGSYEAEWASNVTIGSSGEAAGFADAANQVFAHVENYIKNYGLSEKVKEGKVKFWVVGYSRAGATANLTSKRLVDAFANVGNDIYGYTFEAPMGGVESAKNKTDYTGNGTYPTIHNTVNELDFVTLVAPSEMGFMRYGVDHVIGATDKGEGFDSAYYEQREKMLVQLSAINPYYYFSDHWKVAELSLIYGGLLFGNGVIDDELQLWDDPNEECLSMYDFLRWFFLKVQEYGLNISSIDQSREHYSDFKPLGSIEGNDKTDLPYSDPEYNFGYSDMSVGQAAAELVSMLMGSLTDEQFSALIESVTGSALGFAMTTGVTVGPLLLATLIATPLTALIATGVTAKVVYDLLLTDWDTHSEGFKAEMINTIMHLILNGKNPVWDILTEEQAKAVAEGLPVVLWFALNFASMDNNTSEGDDGMWGIPTFIANMNVIASNHYQEVTVAWVRSYDDYYAGDTRAYRIDTDKVENKAPTGTYARATKTITLSAQEGSSVFYSVDGGETWKLYTKAVALEDAPDQILCFSIYRGVKSEVAEISLNGWAGSLLGNGNIWFLLIGSAFIVGFCVISIEMSRKKKKETENN